MKKIKKILLVASYAPSLINFRGDLIKSLVQSNYEVHISAPNIDKQLKSLLLSYGCRVHDVPLHRNQINFFSDFIYLLRIRRVITDIRPTHMLTYTAKPNIWAGVGSWFTGTKQLMMITGLGQFWATETHLRNRIIQYGLQGLYKLACLKADKVIFQNPDDKDLFLRLGILKNSSKAFIVNGSGVNLNAFPHTKLPNKLSFLCCARLLKSKGITEFAKASIMIKHQYPNVHFRLAGYFDGSSDSISEDELENWIDAGLEFIESPENILRQYQDCSVYVLPSYYGEGTPRTVLEAMAVGRAIITTDSVGCRETVENNYNGLKVGVKSVTELYRAMMSFVNGEYEIEKLGDNSRALAEKKYDVEIVNRHIIQIIEGTINNE